MTNAPEFQPNDVSQMNEGHSSAMPESDTHNRVQKLIESPLLQRIQLWMNKCDDLKLTEAERVHLQDEGVSLLREIGQGPEAEELCDVVKLTNVFLISTQGAKAVTHAQGEWRSVLADYELKGGWKGMLGAWNNGKLDAQLASELPAEHQLVLLRQSLEGLLRTRQYGEQDLPMSMPVVGASVDLAHVQMPEQRGSALVQKLVPPSRLIAAMAVTVADGEKREGNLPRCEELLAIADEERAKALELAKDSPFKRLNLELNGLIAHVAVRGGGTAEALQAFIEDLEGQDSIIPAKKAEWKAHAYALLALNTGSTAWVQNMMDNVRTLASLRPNFMSMISIEPTFKEFAQRFPQQQEEWQKIMEGNR